jgi:hypothetical protein
MPLHIAASISPRVFNVDSKSASNFNAPSRRAPAGSQSLYRTASSSLSQIRCQSGWECSSGILNTPTPRHEKIRRRGHGARALLAFYRLSRPRIHCDAKSDILTAGGVTSPPLDILCALFVEFDNAIHRCFKIESLRIRNRKPGFNTCDFKCRLATSYR